MLVAVVLGLVCQELLYFCTNVDFFLRILPDNFHINIPLCTLHHDLILSARSLMRHQKLSNLDGAIDQLDALAPSCVCTVFSLK